MDSENNGGCKKHLKRLIYGLAKCCPIRPRNSPDAVQVCLELLHHEIPSTLGKMSRSGDDPVQIVREYQLASNALKGSSASDRFYLSLKSPALDFNPDYATVIVATALQNGHAVHFDAHGFIHADPTFRLLEAVMERNVNTNDGARGWSFGLTLPSRWKRSLTDAQWAARKGVRPRLVKGEFRTDASDEMDPEKGFLVLVDKLAGEVPELAVATHDCVLAREAVTRCKRAGTAVQLELLFGMPSGSMTALSRELEVPVRVYVAYGDALIVYLIRDLLTNPRKILRSSSREVVGSLETKLARIIESLDVAVRR